MRHVHNSVSGIKALVAMVEQHNRPLEDWEEVLEAAAAAAMVIFFLQTRMCACDKTQMKEKESIVYSCTIGM